MILLICKNNLPIYKGAIMEYNWLLTTIAQSSAALVTISIAFFVLRIGMYRNEKRKNIFLIYWFVRDYGRGRGDWVLGG